MGGSRLWRSLDPKLGGTWPSSYNFGADLEQLATAPYLPESTGIPEENFHEMVMGVRRWPRGSVIYKSLHFQLTTLYLVLSSLMRLSHQLKSFRPLDSWAVLLGTSVSWVGGQSPRGGALDKFEKCVGLWAVASEEVDIYPGLGAGRSRPAWGVGTGSQQDTWSSQAKQVCSEHGQALIIGRMTQGTGCNISNSGKNGNSRG